MKYAQRAWGFDCEQCGTFLAVGGDPDAPAPPPQAGRTRCHTCGAHHLLGSKRLHSGEFPLPEGLQRRPREQERPELGDVRRRILELLESAKAHTRDRIDFREIGLANNDDGPELFREALECLREEGLVRLALIRATGEYANHVSLTAAGEKLQR